MLADLDVHLPHLASIEVASIVRGVILGGQIDPSQGEQVLENLSALAAVRHAHEPYLQRVWELRNNVSAYDAIYVALAETLDAPLLTCDARLARAPIPSVRIELVSL
jgi:predicted nucleic acid-binding protein